MIILMSKALERVVQAVRELPEAISARSVSGAFDVIATVAAPLTSELDRTVEKKQSSITLPTLGRDVDVVLTRRGANSARLDRAVQRRCCAFAVRRPP